MAIGPIDFGASTGGKYPDPMRLFLIVLDERVFTLNAASLRHQRFLKERVSPKY